MLFMGGGGKKERERERERERETDRQTVIMLLFNQPGKKMDRFNLDVIKWGICASLVSD